MIYPPATRTQRLTRFGLMRKFPASCGLEACRFLTCLTDASLYSRLCNFAFLYIT
jgi:hypothetical protein